MSPWTWVLAAYLGAALLVGGYAWWLRGRLRRAFEKAGEGEEE